MHLTLLKTISGFLHNSSLASTKHAMTKSEQSLWQNKIYHQEPASSLDHCAAICRISFFSNYHCDVFSWDGTTCHIGKNDKTTHTHNVASGVSQIYIDPGITIQKNEFPYTNCFLLQP